MQTSERNGSLIGAVQVIDSDELMLISDQGTLVRTRVGEVSVLSRNTQGVTLIKKKKNEKLVGLVRLDEVEEDDFIEGESVVSAEAAELSEAATEPSDNDLLDPSVQDDESV